MKVEETVVLKHGLVEKEETVVFRHIGQLQEVTALCSDQYNSVRPRARRCKRRRPVSLSPEIAFASMCGCSMFWDIPASVAGMDIFQGENNMSMISLCGNKDGARGHWSTQYCIPRGFPYKLTHTTC